MTRTRIAAGAMATVVALIATGCSSSTPAVTKAGAKLLKPYVVQVRTAAHNRDLVALGAAVNRLEAAASRAAAAGDITEQRQVDIDNAAGALLTDATRKLTTPSPTPSETPSPTPSATTPSPTESPTPSPTPSPSVSSSSPTESPTQTLLPGPPGHSKSSGPPGHNGGGNGPGG